MATQPVTLHQIRVVATDSTNTMRRLRLIAGTNVTFTVVEVETELQVTVNGSSSGSYQPRKDRYTGTGESGSFTLTSRVTNADWIDGVVVARNGQVLTQVSSSPSDVWEYTVADNGSQTTVQLGGNLPAGDELNVMYWA